MCILITHPDFSDPGGVSGYYKHLKDKFNVPVQHFIIGSRPEEKGFIRRTSRMLRDYHRFIKCLKKEDDEQMRLPGPCACVDGREGFRPWRFVVRARLFCADPREVVSSADADLGLDCPQGLSAAPAARIGAVNKFTSTAALRRKQRSAIIGFQLTQ